MRHLYSLRVLHELSLHYSFNEEMEADCAALMALRSPSAALPLLESFSYLEYDLSDEELDDEEEEDEEDDEDEEEDEEDEN